MSSGLTVDELGRAEVRILQYIQRRSFEEEIDCIKSKKEVKQSSQVYRLSPFVSTQGLLCVGGRLGLSKWPEVQKHQIILPSSHPVATLIVNHYHVLSGHSGKEHVLSLIRQKYWMVGARQLTRRVLRKCVVCRKCFAKPGEQRMADLPVDRLTPDKPPFCYVGVDFFGPISVKLGRSQVKRYGCVFTCMAVRAVHIEVASSLDAGSFINALQRFMCRRGQVVEIRSDNGTNFVGGERELREAVHVWNSEKIHEFMRQKEIVWRFNPPTASHMGGVWERQIRTIRKILSALVRQQVLHDDSLSTLLCIVENIINSRPLTLVSDDPDDFEPLTPNHLLQLRTGPAAPPGVFTERDIYCRRRWRQVQYLADVFWRRWTREYLPALQQRSKWNEKRRNLEVGNVVLLVNDGLPRNCWLLGRVVSASPSSDGLVRTVEVKTKNGVLLRPVHKLCFIESGDGSLPTANEC